MTALLVSVRNIDEALTALSGGADMIDVKAPEHGSLGRATVAVQQAVLLAVGGRVPVSAAWGEWDEDDSSPAAGLRYVKWGLAGAKADWPRRLAERADTVGRSRAVATAYADWQRCQAPAPVNVARMAVRLRLAGLLIDTAHKDSSTLGDWLTVSAVAELVAMCRQAGLRVALAGSLRLEHLDDWLTVAPDWLAVRGAACRDGQRQAVIDEQCVRTLAQRIRGFAGSEAARAMS